MPETVAHVIEEWLRKHLWNPILTYFGLLVGLVCIAFAVGYSMTDKHVYAASILFFISFVLLLGGAWHAWKVSHTLKWIITIIATVTFGVADHFWVKSMNQPVPWLLLYINAHLPWVLVFVLGLLLLATLIRRPKETELQAKQFQIHRESTATETPNKTALPLPELRPRIVAVSYSRIAAVPALGFVTVNDGETAYDISIPDVTLGTSVVTFEGWCPRMENRSSTEWRVLIKHDTGGFSTGNYLREEMERQGIGEIAVPIHYRDGNALWYVSHCRIELKASVRDGLAVRTDRQELVSGFPATAPRPYLEVEDPIDEGFGKTFFHFTNTGGDVAHNLQVQPLTVNHLSVVFDPIPILAVNQTKTTIPTIPGIGIAGGHDILNHMEKEWERALLRSGGPEEEKGEWTIQITATYEDFAGKTFEATMDLVVFPMQRLHRNRNALQNPHKKYKTVEVRNTKFRQIL